MLRILGDRDDGFGFITSLPLIVLIVMLFLLALGSL
jgi:hypothetical protein